MSTPTSSQLFHSLPNTPGVSPSASPRRTPRKLPTTPLPEPATYVRTGKRIIVCCDGTWQNGLEVQTPAKYTNVMRLARAISHEDPRQSPPTPQIVFYQSGVGTEKNLFSEYIDGATGCSLADKVEEAYGFIAHNYLPGDEIFLFGFSRGAYTARMVAMFIGEIGVLDRTEMEHFARIFIDYQTLGKSTDQDEIATLHSRLAKWNRHDSPGRLRADYDENTFSIKCVGVFDTVGSLGLPEEFPLRSRRIKTLFGFPDRVLGDHIERAYQALALNEPRADFDCARFEQKPIGRAKGQILQQCWFTGCHSDIGGGYDEHDLADITLIWMAAQVGGMLALDLKYLAARVDPVAPWGMQSPHDPMTGVFMLAHSIQRQLPEGINDVTREVIHSSVLEQSSLYPSVRSLIEKVPELISPLLPLEEEMKVNWPYKPPATLPAAATTTTTTTSTTIQTNVTVAVASSGGSSVIATGVKTVSTGSSLLRGFLDKVHHT